MIVSYGIYKCQSCGKSAELKEYGTTYEGGLKRSEYFDLDAKIHRPEIVENGMVFFRCCYCHQDNRQPLHHDSGDI